MAVLSVIFLFCKECSFLFASHLISLINQHRIALAVVPLLEFMESQLEAEVEGCCTQSLFDAVLFVQNLRERHMRAGVIRPMRHPAPNKVPV